MEKLVWFNGKVTTLDEAAIPAADHAHLYGDGLFEGIRIYHSKVFKLDEHLDRLAHRYGRLLPELLLHLDDEPELAQEVPGGAGTLAVEVVHAATHEGALHVEDVLTRRTRLYLEAGDRGLAAARVVAHLMGEALGWDEQRRTEEVSRYQRRVAAELDAQAAPDDAAAAEIRERVSDPRIG